MNSPPIIRIVLIDDHPAILLGLRSIFKLQPDMEVIATCARGSDLAKLTAEMAPTLFLVDLRMPEMSGVAVVRTISRRFPAARILILTSFNLDEEIFRALEAGAHGSMLKNIDPDEMLSAIRKVAAGESYISPDIALRLEERSGRSALTSRELAILQRVATGCTNKQTGTCLRISEFTVRNHLNRIMSKLHVDDRTEAVMVAVRSGLISLED